MMTLTVIGQVSRMRRTLDRRASTESALKQACAEYRTTIPKNGGTHLPKCLFSTTLHGLQPWQIHVS